MIRFTPEEFTAHQKRLAKLKAASTVRVHRCLDAVPKPDRPVYQDGRNPNTACIFCGIGFYVRPYLLRKGQGRFCSQQCYGEWRSREHVK